MFTANTIVRKSKHYDNLKEKSLKNVIFSRLFGLGADDGI